LGIEWSVCGVVFFTSPTMRTNPSSAFVHVSFTTRPLVTGVPSATLAALAAGGALAGTTAFASSVVHPKPSTATKPSTADFRIVFIASWTFDGLGQGPETDVDFRRHAAREDFLLAHVNAQCHTAAH
jgi:hypothetical protein